MHFAKSLRLSALGAALAAFAWLPAGDWKPIDRENLELSESTVEPGADAEAIFWEVRVEDELSGGDPKVVLEHYIRIKIFNERGRGEHGTVEIPYTNKMRIRNIKGRTVQPGGAIVELDKDSVFERDVVKASGIKVKAKSFAMPDVQPGSIIEYRWREIRYDQITNYEEFQFQREIPIQRVTYFIKPMEEASRAGYGMRGMSLNGQRSPFRKEGGGWVSTTMTDVKAFREEPYMPPEAQVRPWMLLYYTDEKENSTPADYWGEYAKEQYNRHKKAMKVDKEIKRLAAKLLQGVDGDEERLRVLFDYCRNEITNVYDDAVDSTEKERKKVENNKKPKDTLKRGMGDSYDIDMLFAALAEAAGYESRWARIGDSSYYFFDPALANSHFLPSWAVAVRVNDEWRFFDPASRYVPFGMLRWQEEGQLALIADRKNPVFVRTPVSSPQRSMRRRTAELKLLEDGTLEGDMRIEFTGHLAAWRRERFDARDENERESALEELIDERLPGAEVSEANMEHVIGDGPLIYTCRVRIPGYAQRTGSRLFLQPSFFQRGRPPRFSAPTRVHPIHFRYAWMEEDEVRVELPEGYDLSSLRSPPDFRSSDVAEYTVEITPQGERSIVYKRRFMFKGLLFPPESYHGLKTLFDNQHERDNFTLILKRSQDSETEGGR